MFYDHFRYEQYYLKHHNLQYNYCEISDQPDTGEIFPSCFEQMKNTFVFHVSVKKNQLNIELIKKIRKFFVSNIIDLIYIVNCFLFTFFHW